MKEKTSFSGKSKDILLVAWILLMTCIIGCDSSENVVPVEDQISLNTQINTRSVGVKTPKLTVYIETNDINPLNAGEYLFCNTSEEAVDHVILFASNIHGNATNAWLHHNYNQTYILNNVDSLVLPLQQKGIKVILAVLGDWTGVGFSNLTPFMLESFAQQVVSCVNTYGFDGVEFDDEYADYSNAPAGLPSPSTTIYGNLIKRVKQLLPGKLITAFDFGGYTNFDTATLNVIDYMWPYYGCNPNPHNGLPASKWAKLSMRIFNEGGVIPGTTTIRLCANNYTGYGAVMMFNLREWNTSPIMNNFAPLIWNGRTICWTGVSHPKSY